MFLHNSEKCIVKLGERVSKRSLKNGCSLRIKLSSILLRSSIHMWEEVDFRNTIGRHLFLLSESTELVAYTRFCFIDLAPVSCS